MSVRTLPNFDQTLIITVNVWNQKKVSGWLQLNNQYCWIQWNTALLQKSKRVSQFFVLEIHCQSKSVVLDETGEPIGSSSEERRRGKIV